LSALCLEETGLTALEFLDRIRVRDFRAELTEQTRADVAEWLEYLEREDEVVSDHDWNVVAQRFLKWRRGTGRGVVRQRWAWSLGLATRGRLSKAVFLTDGLTLEELELEVACEVVKRAANADPEPMTMERSELREMFDAPGAEKAEPPEDGISIEPQRDGDTEKGEGTEGEGSVRGELDSSLEGLGAGEVA
jgi:hypothetical protein